MTKYLKTIDEKYDPSIHGQYVDDFDEKYFQSKYEFDDFQKHSFNAIKKNNNVLVVAPTSSGKTDVAKYAILYNLLSDKNGKENRGKVVYTTPIKSLSNEKYDEMKNILNQFDIQVGLLTGDQKINTDAPFLIMTTEILANALYSFKHDEQKQQYGLDNHFVTDIRCVIFDEIHFISDKNRGFVWESSIILLDSNVQIIGLSATIDNPVHFGTWIGNIKQKDITLVKKYDRPVPLEYSIFDGSKCHTILDREGEYSIDNFNKANKKLNDIFSKHYYKYSDVKRTLINDFVQYAKEKDLIQLCFIVFSKKNCENFADMITISLMEREESKKAINELDRRMGIYLKSYKDIPRYRQIKKLISRGVCFHHAGLPVILKEVIEQLYKTGYIKVLFATETIAIGVNMPIRTLVMTSLKKITDNTGLNDISATEFKQICGRAGRRGIDHRGLIVFLPLFGTFDEVDTRQKLIYGPLQKIKSTMEINYHTYLKLLHTQVIDKNIFFDNSLLSIDNVDNSDDLTKKINDHEIKFNIVKTKMSEQYAEYERNNMIVVYNKLKNNAKLKNDDIFMSKEIPVLIKQNQKLYNLFVEYYSDEKKLDELVFERDNYMSYKELSFDRIINFLTKMEYLDENGELTKYGKLVPYINECNPFLLVEIFESDILHTLDIKQIIVLLSTLVESRRNNEDFYPIIDSDVNNAVEYLEQRAYEYIKLENSMKISSGNYWNVTYDYVEITNKWIELESCNSNDIFNELNDIDMYEGEFVKIMMTINNIINNLILLCNLTQKLDLLPVLAEAEKIIIKGIVNADSLHIL